MKYSFSTCGDILRISDINGYVPDIAEFVFFMLGMGNTVLRMYDGQYNVILGYHEELAAKAGKEAERNLRVFCGI